MRDKPRLGARGLLVWALAIASAFLMAWLDLQRMIERGDFDRPPAAQPAEPAADATVQAVDVVSEPATGAPSSPPEAVDAGAR